VGIAQFVMDNHVAGSQSLVILNRVARARETYDALNRIAKQPLDIRLLHSRFRGHERLGWSKLLSDGIPAGGRVLVATQVVEAGVDISSALLVTDLAPYTGLVQRFGRCNRAGEFDEGRIFWVDRTGEEASPYESEDLEQSRPLIAELDSARIDDLPRPPDGFEHGDIIRRRDLLDLFDTTRDLSGYDIDISRFIREGDERDVMVAWRELPDDGPDPKTVAPTRDELCAAPIGEFRKFLDKALKNKKRREAWTWSAIDREWRKVTSQDADLLRPGMILIVDSKAGGYDVVRGWDFESLAAVPVVPTDGAEPEGMGGEPLTNQKYRQTVMAHSREVRSQAESIVGQLDNSGIGDFVDDLLYASLRHDIGKCHWVFQESMHRRLTADEAAVRLFLAKTEFHGRHSRPHFRHELASALALLQMGAPDLAVYLAACHHGKVRLSIRAMPGETKPDKPDVRFARGVHEGDSLPEVDLGGGAVIPSIVLDLEPMLLGMSEDGRRSWLDRMIGLRDKIGVFRLAYLESLIRAADARASAAPVEVL
jgi:CRISPR-associated endonuclease/helicase Cas3